MNVNTKIENERSQINSFWIFFSKKNYLYDYFSKRFLRKRIKFASNMFLKKIKILKNYFFWKKNSKSKSAKNIFLHEKETS